MTQPTFLSSAELWPTLKGLARGSREQRVAVTAYLGTGASKMLPLRDGDVLLCALSLANSRAGNVNPAEIRALMNRGVKVYSQADLHAKVYLLGDCAVVCSANMSAHSEQRLDEAGAVIRGRAVHEIRRWVNQRLGSPVQPLFLIKCEKVYRPPRFDGAAPTKRGENSQNARDLDRLWLVQTDATEDYPEEELKAATAGVIAAQKRLERPRLDEIDSVRWTGNDLFSRI
jgi:phosphatidylserine/phosphatidylglycerophosphate/cardiolipin synthase-like enzyme